MVRRAVNALEWVILQLSAELVLQKRMQVCRIENEELLVGQTGNRKRLFSHLKVDSHSAQFLLDCGATVNLLPMATAQLINAGLTRRTSARSALYI